MARTANLRTGNDDDFFVCLRVFFDAWHEVGKWGVMDGLRRGVGNGRRQHVAGPNNGVSLTCAAVNRRRMARVFFSRSSAGILLLSSPAAFSRSCN